MSDYISEARLRAAASLQAASIALTPLENDAIEVADFGLGRHAETGLQMLLREQRTVLRQQPLPDPPGGVALLARCADIVGQPSRIVTLCGPTSGAVRDGTRPFPRQPQFGR